MAATKKPTKKEAKSAGKSLAEQLRKKGYKLPHGYEVSVRKKK